MSPPFHFKVKIKIELKILFVIFSREYSEKEKAISFSENNKWKNKSFKNNNDGGSVMTAFHPVVFGGILASD